MTDAPTPSAGEITLKALRDLEWPAVLDRFAGRCACPGTVERLRARDDLPAFAESRDLARRGVEALELSGRGEKLPVAGLDDLDDVFQRVRRGAAVSGPELLAVQRLLGLARELRQFLAGQGDLIPALAAALSTPAHLDSLLTDLRRALDDDGTIADAASDALRLARARAGDLRHELRKKLAALMRRYASSLQETYFTEHDGRYTLPVRSDSLSQVPGIVLGSSGSGSTLYVEPQELTPIGNRLRVALADVEREEAKAMARLCGKVLGKIDEVEAAYEVALEADRLAAVVRWASEQRGRVLEPDESPRLRLKDARHPLLVEDLDDVVGNDLELEGGGALVISGPNAGGKTVALKTLGLAALLVAHGLPVPCAVGSRVGHFSRVAADVGDAQSLSMSLSTFSAHVAHLAGVLALAGPGTLVLLDEVAGGTDPEEGGVLAAAALESLTLLGAAVAVTTHYERLKELAAMEARFRNASVGFDLERMVPTFRVVMDVPGPSSALAVARRFGIPGQLLDRARSLLPDTALEREALIRQLETDRAAAARARAEAEAEQLRQVEARQDLERALATEAERERKRMARESSELTQSVQAARAALHAARTRLKKADLTAADVRALEKDVSGAAQLVAVGGDLQAAARGTEPERPQVKHLAVGDRVFVAKLGQHGEVVEAPKGPRDSARVRVGAFTLQVAANDLRSGDGKGTGTGTGTGKGNGPAGSRRRRKEAPSTSGVVPMRTRDNTLDLRGQRVDDAINMVDAFLDELLHAGEQAGYVLHGHGTGALKSAIRTHLKNHRYLLAAEPAEMHDGGDAFTVVHLR